MGKREYIICHEPYLLMMCIRFQKTWVLIEDLHETKLEKYKIMNIILSGRHVALTFNKKDVPKSIINMCQVKFPGKYDRRQD